MNNTALCIKAERNLLDSNGIKRIAGEKYLIRNCGSFLPGVYEKIEKVVKGVILTDKNCLHLKALRNFIDCYNVARKSGEEWLITNDIAEVHIADAYEEIIKEDKVISLSNREYCFILNPFVNGKNNLGSKILRKVINFFIIKNFNLYF